MDSATQAILEVARDVVAELDLDVVLGRVLEAAQELTAARYAALGVLDEDRRALARFLTRGIDEAARAAIGDPPHGDGLLGALLEASKPVRTRNVSDHPLAHGFSHRHRPMGSLLGVPIVIDGTSIGSLYLGEKLDVEEFSEQDERVAVVLVELAAIAIDRARRPAPARGRDDLGEDERRRQRLAAAEDERRRWARELHDETLQSMGALRLVLSAAGRSEEVEALRDAVVQAVEQLEQTIADLRALITDLRPAALDQIGLEAAIEALAERSARHGIEVDLSIELGGGERLDGELETTLYRVVQEALTNASKHGGAQRAVVEIVEVEGAVSLSVRDDGRGFDPEARSDGFGLIGMRERIALLGGELLIDSSLGGGALVSARMPLIRAAGGGPAAPPASA